MEDYVNNEGMSRSVGRERDRMIWTGRGRQLEMVSCTREQCGEQSLSQEHNRNIGYDVTFHLGSLLTGVDIESRILNLSHLSCTQTSKPFNF